MFYTYKDLEIIPTTNSYDNKPEFYIEYHEHTLFKIKFIHDYYGTEPHEVEFEFINNKEYDSNACKVESINTKIKFIVYWFKDTNRFAIIDDNNGEGINSAEFIYVKYPVLNQIVLKTNLDN